MVVAIEKASIPDVDENFLRLKDRSCPLTSNSTHIIGKIPFSTCGTKLEVWSTSACCLTDQIIVDYSGNWVLTWQLSN